MRITIESVTGRKFRASVEERTTIASLKSRLARVLGVFSSELHFIWHNEELGNDSTFGGLGIPAESTIKLTLSMQGGPVNYLTSPPRSWALYFNNLAATAEPSSSSTMDGASTPSGTSQACSSEEERSDHGGSHTIHGSGSSRASSRSSASSSSMCSSSAGPTFEEWMLCAAAAASGYDLIPHSSCSTASSSGTSTATGSRAHSATVEGGASSTTEKATDMATASQEALGAAAASSLALLFHMEDSGGDPSVGLMEEMFAMDDTEEEILTQWLMWKAAALLATSGSTSGTAAPSASFLHEGDTQAHKIRSQKSDAMGQEHSCNPPAAVDDSSGNSQVQKVIPAVAKEHSFSGKDGGSIGVSCDLTRGTAPQPSAEHASVAAPKTDGSSSATAHEPEVSSFTQRLSANHRLGIGLTIGAPHPPLAYYQGPVRSSRATSSRTKPVAARSSTVNVSLPPLAHPPPKPPSFVPVVDKLGLLFSTQHSPSAAGSPVATSSTAMSTIPQPPSPPGPVKTGVLQPSAKRLSTARSSSNPPSRALLPPISKSSGHGMEVSSPNAAGIVATQDNASPSVKVGVTRCQWCQCKVGLCNQFTCRCGVLFCSKHRNPESHACPYDFKTEGRHFIQQNNPIIRASKLPKI